MYYRHYCFPSDLQAVFNVAIREQHLKIIERKGFLYALTQ